MTAPKPAFPVNDVRGLFPQLSVPVNGVPLVYLDSAATSLKLGIALNRELDFSSHEMAAVNRGAHTLAAEATEKFDEARATVARFVGARPANIVWTSNATDAFNVVANGFRAASLGLHPVDGPFRLQPGDEIVLTELEHHANLIPWQELARATGAVIRVAAVDDGGVLTVEAVRDVLSARTKLVTFPHVSNVIGIVNPVRDIADAAHEAGAVVMLDACQSAPHLTLNFAELGVDFAAFSAHKMYGPTGIGALYGTTSVLNLMPPTLFGGSMITYVDFERAEYLPAPAKFEPGTPRLSQAVGWAASLDVLSAIGLESIAAHERELGNLLYDLVEPLPGIRILGTRDNVERVGLLSVAVDGVHPHDVGQFLDSRGIAVRVGHHCAQPLHRRLGVDSSTRFSVGMHTTRAESEFAVDALAQVRAYFGEA